MSNMTEGALRSAIVPVRGKEKRKTSIQAVTVDISEAGPVTYSLSLSRRPSRSWSYCDRGLENVLIDEEFNMSNQYMKGSR